MRPLSAQDVIQLWERGQDRHPLDRALLLLANALPNMTADALTQLPIGQRDALLLSLRELTLGSKLESLAQCPHCGESLEFTLDVSDLRLSDSEIASQGKQMLTDQGLEIHFSLPNSLDLAAILSCPDLPTARQMLADRCIQKICSESGAIAPELLPTSALEQLAARMAECDPQAEILLNLKCPACGQSWQVLFDIVTFFWTELGAYAKRLLREVHTLARAYGWREADILALSPTRRQIYLDLVSGSWIG
jgi:T4 bacteriophage base plate protein